MRSKSLSCLLLAAMLIIGTGASVHADTIRLRDGSILRGEIVAFADQQFTILVGSGVRGRRSRITIYMEDVESIIFERTVTQGADAAPTGNNADATTPAATSAPGSTGVGSTTGGSSSVNNDNVAANNTNETATPPARGVINPTVTPRATSPDTSATSGGAVNFREASLRVRGDATTNGWTNAGVILRRGQRVRISASGRIALGNGRFSTPAGVPTLDDDAKLMRGEATGGLIAVIGDDNDEFVFIGARREFVAPRDGVLFLGVNEGNLNDNTGNYDVTVAYEAK